MIDGLFKGIDKCGVELCDEKVREVLAEFLEGERRGQEPTTVDIFSSNRLDIMIIEENLMKTK
jgi:hypothetical protein